MITDSLDTNLILRFINNDIPSQRQRVIKLLATPNTTHYLSDLALSETVYVLETSIRMTRQEIVDQLSFFLARYSHCIAYNQPLTSLAFPFYLTHPKLSFNDCCLAAYAELEAHEPLFTFDQKLARQLPSAKLCP